MKKLISTLVAAVCSLAMFACAGKPIPEHSIEVYLEAPTSSSSFGLHEKITMPVSGIQAAVTRPAVVAIDAFTNAEMLYQDDPTTGESLLGIRLRLKDEAWLDVYQASMAAISNTQKRGGIPKKFFLVVDGHPIGYCKITRAIRRDDFFFYIETNKRTIREIAEELEELKFNLNEYILAWREYKKEK